MKRDLRGMAGDTANQGQQQGQKATEQDLRYLQDMAAQYSGKSQNELMEELMRTAAQEKQKGTLNPAMLDQFFNSIGPMLTSEQRDRMASLINQIR